MGGRLTCVDSSHRMIENAKSHDPNNDLRIKYFQGSSNSLSFLGGESFDIVFANMTLMDMEDGEGAIREVSRVLRKGSGRFVASISHPCFDNGQNSGWVVEKVMLQTTTYRKIRAYRQPFSEEIPWRFSPDERRWTTAYHRPLSWYARALRSAGLFITALEERNRDSAERIKALMFTFEDLGKLDGTAIQAILRSAEKDKIPIALKGASETLRDLFFSHMSERAGKLLREEIQAMGPVRLKDVEESQSYLVSIAKDLAARGEIVISDGSAEDELVY